MNDIVSRQELKTELSKIVKENGFKGPVAELLISVCATTYYNILSKCISISRENIMDSAANYNSLISLAMKRMYSVFRGTNPKLTLTGSSSKLQVLKRGTLVYSGTDFNLYVESDIEIPVNKEVNIPLVAAPDFKEISKVTNPNAYFIEFREDNLSEDFILYKQNDQEGDNTSTKCETTTSLREHISEGTIFELTIQDWGVRFYEKGLEDMNVMLSVFKYLDNGDQLVQDFLTDKLRSDGEKVVFEDTFTIKGFTFKYLTITEDTDGNVIGYQSPRESKQDIKNHYSYQINTVSLIRSNSDFLEVFNQMFIKYLFDSFCETYNSSSEITNVAYTSRTPKIDSYPLTVIYYSPRSKNSFISDVMMQEFTEAVKYYAVGNTLCACPGEVKSLDVVITLVKNTDSAIDDINEILSNYDGKFHKTLSILGLQSEINKLNSVKKLEEFRIYQFDTQSPTGAGYSLEGEIVNDTDYEYFDLDVDTGDILRVTGINPKHNLIEYFDARGNLIGTENSDSIYRKEYEIPAKVARCIISILRGSNLVQLCKRVEDISCKSYQYLSIESKIKVYES